MIAYVRISLFLALAVVAVAMEAKPARAQKMELVAAGELGFQTSCAVCHGVDTRPGNHAQTLERASGKPKASFATKRRHFSFLGDISHHRRQRGRAGARQPEHADMG